MNQLQKRLSKLEQTAKPCFMAQTCFDLERRYVEAFQSGRVIAFLDRRVLKVAESQGESVIDLRGETLIIGELKTRLESYNFTDLDDKAEQALESFFVYGRSVVRPSAPDSFLPLESRDTEEKRKALDLSYFIETDKEARRLWLEILAALEQIAAEYPC